MAENENKFAQRFTYGFDGSDVTIIPMNMNLDERLPTGFYCVKCSQQRGVWLSADPGPGSVPSKIYGKTEYRVQKTFEAFNRRPGNTGVILVGEAGMGKSLFIKLACQRAIAENIPVIFVKDNFPGQIELLYKITCPCLIVLDEFEKNFGMNNSDDSRGNEQNQFLSLMDGMATGKRLFIAAINNRWKVSDYFFNRPGRFLYNYEFSFLSNNEIHDYVTDNLNDKSKIPAVISGIFGHNINYDSLSAICSEVNAGYSLEETLEDLNIDNKNQYSFDVTVTCRGHIFTCTNVTFKPDRDGEVGFWIYAKDKKINDLEGFEMYISFKYEALKIVGDEFAGKSIHVPGEAITCSGNFDYDGDNNDDRDNKANKFIEGAVFGELIAEKHMEFRSKRFTCFPETSMDA